MTVSANHETREQMQMGRHLGGSGPADLLLDPFSASEHSLLPCARLAYPDQIPSVRRDAARVRQVGSQGV